MPRLTIDIDNRFNDTLASLAGDGSKADVLRRAVASYRLLNSEIGSADPGTRLSLTAPDGQIQKDIVLPALDPSRGSDIAGSGQPLSPHQASIAQPHLQDPQIATVSPDDVGSVEIAPPSFLERWGVIFLACFGGWIIVTGTVILLYFLRSQPPSPGLAGLSPDQLRDALLTHKQLVEQWRDSLTYIFDLLITKTALPLVTLLLGYLFGKGQASSG